MKEDGKKLEREIEQRKEQNKRFRERERERNCPIISRDERAWEQSRRMNRIR